MSDTDGVSITFELRLRPEAAEGFVGNIQEMLKGTAAFPGFRAIRIVQHKDEPGRFLFIERWDSEQAYREYLAWRAKEGAMDSLRQAALGMEANVWPILIGEAKSPEPIAETEGVSITFALTLQPGAVPPFTAGGAAMFKDVTGFAGFRGIRMVQHAEDPTRILYIERWAREEDYKAYVAWQTERGGMKALERMVSAAETNVWPKLVAHA
jgi:quinol monooxygenase YgiN